LTADEVGTLAVDEWVVTFGTARRGRIAPHARLAVSNHSNVTTHCILVRCFAVLMCPLKG